MMNDFNALPERIRENCSFCCWRREERNGRVTKVPYTPTSGTFARSNDVKTFRPFDKALNAYTNSQGHSRPYDGLGICVDGTIGAIDIDHCIDEAGNLNEVAAAVLGAFNDCYFEVSPSGTGLRGFFELSPDFRYDPSIYYIKNSTYGLEIYLPGYTSRFVTVTGNVYHTGPVSNDMDALQVILDTFMVRRSDADSHASVKNNVSGAAGASDDKALIGTPGKSKAAVITSATGTADATEGTSDATESIGDATASVGELQETRRSYLTDEEVIEKASASSNGALFKDLYEGCWEEHSEKYISQSEADMAFASMLAFWCGCDFEQMNRIFESSGLYREKWNREQSGSSYGALTLEKAIESCRNVYVPTSAMHSNAAEDFEAVESTEDAESDVAGEDRDAASDVEEIDERLYLSPVALNIFHMSEMDAVSELRALLSEDSDSLNSERILSDEVVALAARSFRMAPTLYEMLRQRVKKMGMRVGTLDLLFDGMKAAMFTAGQREKLERAHNGVPVPDFVIYNMRKGCYEVDCPRLTKHVRENLHYLLVQDGGMDAVLKYVYDGGCYYICSDDRMKGYIKKFITDYDENLLHMSTVDEVFRQLTTEIKAMSSKVLNQNEGIINFRNGILHLDTMELQPHSPDIFSTVQLPCEWKGAAVGTVDTSDAPDADTSDTSDTSDASGAVSSVTPDAPAPIPTPVFDAFMDTLSNHRPEVEKLLLQFMGVCLSNVKGWRLKKALFLYGEGNTGKSQIKGLTEMLLGPENCIGIDLDKIEDRFGTSAIYHKRLAGSSDMKFMTIRELETFKQCTGGDSLFAEFKNLPAFHFTYEGLLWFCSNRAPKFGGDQGDWVYDRMILVDCNNVVPVEKRDRQLLDKMYAERDGIVYKAVMALKQVIENGYKFDESEAILDNRHAYKLQNNSVLRFFEECMEERKKPGSVPLTDRFTVNKVYKIYIEWCEFESDGYKCKFPEFKDIYGSYCGMPTEECIGARNGGKYFLYHRLLPELHEGYWYDSEPAFVA